MAAEYFVAEREVLDLVDQVIEQYEPGLGESRIGVLMRSVAPRSAGKRVMGRAKLVGPEQQALFPPGQAPDFVIWLAQDVWEELSPAQKMGLCHHLLCSCHVQENGKRKMRRPDIVEHRRVIECHGLWWPQSDEDEQVLRATLGLQVERTGRVFAVDGNFDANLFEPAEEEEADA